MSEYVKTLVNDTSEDLVETVRILNRNIIVLINPNNPKEYEFVISVVYEEVIASEETEGSREVKSFNIDIDDDNSLNPNNLTELEARLAMVIMSFEKKGNIELNDEQGVEIVDKIITDIKDFLQREDIYYKD